MTINDVKNLVATEGYEKLLAMVATSLKLKVNDTIPPSQMFNIEADGINKSNISPSEIERVCSDEANRIMKFINAKLSIIKEDEVDDYNEDGDKDTVIEKLPYYKTFLIGHVIEFIFLKEYPDKLDGYLKLLRVPKYKKYASELSAIYSKI